MMGCKASLPPAEDLRESIALALSFLDVHSTPAQADAPEDTTEGGGSAASHEAQVRDCLISNTEFALRLCIISRQFCAFGILLLHG